MRLVAVVAFVAFARAVLARLAAADERLNELDDLTLRLAHVANQQAQLTREAAEWIAQHDGPVSIPIRFSGQKTRVH